MTSGISLVPSSISAIVNGVRLWREKKSNTDADATAKKNAIHQVMRAAIATKAYIYDMRELGKPSREKEHELSNSWQEAAASIFNYDKNLFESSKVKSLGWADPREWEKANNKAVTVNLESIIEQCEWLLENET